jgi:hypothetical protein
MNASPPSKPASKSMISNRSSTPEVRARLESSMLFQLRSAPSLEGSFLRRREKRSSADAGSDELESLVRKDEAVEARRESRE